MTVRIVKLIVATNAHIGKGVAGDPIRGVLQLYSLDGKLILEIDPGDGDKDGPSLRQYNDHIIRRNHA